MGVQIKAASAVTSQRWRKPAARRLADAAAHSALALAGKNPGDVDMLINAGVYREDNMGEPALAALIQEDIGANRGQPPVSGHGTFSFDLANGPCGVINAIQLEASLLRSGVIRLGAIVTSDVCPNPCASETTLFSPAGGAMLLGWEEGTTGFAAFHTETFPEYEDLLVSGLVWQERRGWHTPLAGTGRSRMVVDRKPGYQARLVDCAEEAVHRFLHRLHMGVGDVGLLVPAPSSAQFLDPLRMRLGIPGDRIAYTAEDLAGSYTTGPIAALQAAVKAGRLGEARNALMLAAGAGITVALALYRQAP